MKTTNNKSDEYIMESDGQTISTSGDTPFENLEHLESLQPRQNYAPKPTLSEDHPSCEDITRQVMEAITVEQTN